MKTFAQILFFLVSSFLAFQHGLLAQNWLPFPANQKTWFQFENDSINVAALYYARNIIEEGDKTWYFLDPNNTVFKLSDTLCISDYKNKGEDFINISEPFSEQNGLHYYKGQLVFNSNLNAGEGVFIQSENYSDFDEVYIECTEQRNENIFEKSDEVKEFNLQAYANGEPIVSVFDNYSYILSKSHGFLQFLPFIELLDEPKTNATLTGLENEQDTLLGDKGNQFKPPYEVGDVIYYSKVEDRLNRIEGSRVVLKSTRYWRDSITAIVYYNDSLTYTFDRFEIEETYNLTPPKDYVTIFDTLQTSNNQKVYVYGKEIDPLVDRGIYGYAIRPCYPDALNFCYVDVNIHPHFFSFNNEIASVVDVSQTGYPLWEDGCLGFPNFNIGTKTYHTELGKIYESLADDCCIDETWKLDIYKKGDLMHGPFLRLNSTYSNIDKAFELADPSNRDSLEIVGPGVMDYIFNPALVPDDLLDTPFEIIFKLHVWEFKQTVTVTDDGDVIDYVLDEDIFLKMHPNPNNGIFYISTSEPFTAIKIYNSYGALVFSENKTHTVNAQHLSNGIYLVEILNQNKVLAVEKLIVQ